MDNYKHHNSGGREKIKVWMVVFAFILFSVMIAGGFWLFTTPGQAVNITFAYVVGLSMIVLPCTLPLAFVIVPLAMKQSPKKGLMMAVLFGLGLSITLSLYGVFIAWIGKIVGLDAAISQAGTVSRILFITGGLAAFVFGLSELGLIKFKIPGFSGSYPQWIVSRGDYLKAFFLGLFLGNAGVGCPNPLFYVLLGDIAVIGSLSHGWWLGFIHGVGRATPLVFLTILGILGINAVSKVAEKGVLVKKISGWVLIILGAFIFINGTSHNWYENSAIHRGWNKIVRTVGGENIAERMEHKDPEGIPKEHIDMQVSSLEDHDDSGVPPLHGHIVMEGQDEDHNAKEADDIIPEPWPPVVLIVLILGTYIWYRVKHRGQKIEN